MSHVHGGHVVATLFVLFSLAFALPSFFTLTSYAPISAECPTTPVTRIADGLSQQEAAYRANRSMKAAESLRTLLGALNKDLPTNNTFSTDVMPVIGLASSGGSIRALLTGAGVIQAMDSRDRTTNPSSLWGLWQGITYHSGPDGGSWLVAALAGNSGATISTLVANSWISGYSDASLLPANLRNSKAYSTIAIDCTAEALAGYSPTLVDTWGRLLSQNILQDNDGGIKTTISGLMNSSDFQDFNVPYPIITALAIDPSNGYNGCVDATASSTQYEFHPYEFGSWEKPVRSFSLTRYMGSPLVDNGMALAPSNCLHNFDNLGFLIGASSNNLNYFCGQIPSTIPLSGQLGVVQSDLVSDARSHDTLCRNDGDSCHQRAIFRSMHDADSKQIAMTSMIHGLSFYDEYGVIPSPFVSTSSVSQSSPADNIYLVNGGQGGENLPMAPLMAPERAVDVIIANDNSADTADFFPNGTSLYKSYLKAVKQGPPNWPVIPPPEFFVEQGLNRKPTVFGCNDTSKVTIIYLPNAEYTYPSNIPDWQLGYNSSTVSGMVANGNSVATMGGRPTWPFCLACVGKLKVDKGELPVACKPCLQEFCWSG